MSSKLRPPSFVTNLGRRTIHPDLVFSIECQTEMNMPQCLPLAHFVTLSHSRIWPERMWEIGYRPSNSSDNNVKPLPEAG